MTKREAQRQTHQENVLVSLGFTTAEAESLRRISMTLHRWYEQECGDSNDYNSWSIERDETTDKPYRCVYPHTGKMRRTLIADRETGAIRRLKGIIEARNMRDKEGVLYAPEDDAKTLPLFYYLQTDPRGAPLYILRPGDVPEGADVSGYYSRGICVY